MFIKNFTALYMFVKLFVLSSYLYYVFIMVYITKPQMNQKLYKPVAYSNLSIDYNSWLVCCDNLEHTPRYIVKGLHVISVRT